jgi:formylglycine-generating enzyme required for sulfatase activity
MDQYAIYSGGTYTLPGTSLPFAPVGSTPLGTGPWGHFDLGGNVNEWTLDAYADLPQPAVGAPCVDCADFTAGGNRVGHGGSAISSVGQVESQARNAASATSMSIYWGFRCARVP